MSKCQEVMDLRLSLPDEHVLYFSTDIIEGNIPLLPVLDVMQGHGLILDFIKIIFPNGHYNWDLSITHQQEHAFVRSNTFTIFFKKPEQTRLHLHFFHLSSNKVYPLLDRIDPVRNTPDVNLLLDDINKACAESREFSTRPYNIPPRSSN